MVKVSLDVGIIRLTNNLKIVVIAGLWCCSVCWRCFASRDLFLATEDRHCVVLFATCITQNSKVVRLDSRETTWFS